MLATLHTVALLLAPVEHAITWQAPASCPDASDVQDRVAEQLRGVDVEPAHVRAQVTAPALQGEKWRMQIAIGDEGEREIEGESCAALADAAAVMIAVSASAEDSRANVPEPPLADEPASIAAAPTHPSSRPTGASELAAAQSQSSELVAARPSRSADRAPPTRRAWGPPQAVLGIMTGLHGAGLPAIGAGVGGHLGIRWGPLQAALTGAHWIRRERPVVDEVTAAYQLGTGGLELCGVLALGRVPARLELLACAEAEAGILRAEGQRAEPSRTLRDPWIAVGGGLGVLWAPRSWLAAGLRADLVAPMLRREFVVGDVAAGSVGPVDARGTLVLQFRLPAIVEAG